MLRINGYHNYRSYLVDTPFNAVDVTFSDEADDEPVTLEEVKLWCKIDVDEDDDILTSLITVARQQCEDYTGVSIIERTVTAILNNSCGGIYLPYGPVVSPITTITDSDGEEIEEDNYTLTEGDFPQLIEPSDDRITVEYEAGYEAVPGKFKTAIKEQVFYLYNNRGETNEKATLSPMAQSILKPLRRV